MAATYWEALVEVDSRRRPTTVGIIIGVGATAATVIEAALETESPRAVFYFHVTEYTLIIDGVELAVSDKITSEQVSASHTKPWLVKFRFSEYLAATLPLLTSSLLIYHAAGGADAGNLLAKAIAERETSAMKSGIWRLRSACSEETCAPEHLCSFACHTSPIIGLCPPFSVPKAS